MKKININIKKPSSIKNVEFINDKKIQEAYDAASSNEMTKQVIASLSNK